MRFYTKITQDWRNWYKPADRCF